MTNHSHLKYISHRDFLSAECNQCGSFIACTYMYDITLSILSYPISLSSASFIFSTITASPRFFGRNFESLLSHRIAIPA